MKKVVLIFAAVLMVLACSSPAPEVSTAQTATHEISFIYAMTNGKKVMLSEGDDFTISR